MADRALAERDKDFWSTRMRALTSLAASDALAVVLPLPDGRYVSYADHNIGRDPAWLDGAAQYLVWSAVKQRAVQQRSETLIALNDGRTANSIVVAPIPWSDRIIGALVALRVADTYEQSVGASPGDLAQLVGLELAVSSALQRSAIEPRPDDTELRRALDDRRHAIALYEVSKLGLRGAGPVKTAAVIADVLSCGVVGIWLDEDGWLRLDDGHGYAADQGRVRVETDATALRVLRDGMTQRVQGSRNGGAAWMGPATDAIAAPFAVSGDIHGMLVLGQPARPFTREDLTIAPTLAATAWLARAHRAVSASNERPEIHLTPPASVLEVTLPDARPTPSTTSTGSAEAAPTPRTRRRWVVPLLVLAAIAAAGGALLGEPLIFVLAGLLVLVAVWGRLA